MLRNSSDPDPKPDQVPDSDFWPDPDLVNMDPSKILLRSKNQCQEIMYRTYFTFYFVRLHIKGLIRMVGFLKEKFSGTSSSCQPPLFSQAASQPTSGAKRLLFIIRFLFFIQKPLSSSLKGTVSRETLLN